jgi:predicted O-linked N-acetylglucosamine transferase (SPINDLY family)
LETEQPNGTLDRKQKLKQKRAERKKKKALLKEKLQTNSEAEDADNEKANNVNNVEVEYVVANPLDELETADPIFKEFAEIFSKFSNQDLVKKKQQDLLENEKKETEKGTIGILSIQLEFSHSKDLLPILFNHLCFSFPLFDTKYSQFSIDE